MKGENQAGKRPQPFGATDSGRVASILQERVPPSDKPRANRRPQLVLEQGLEAFPSMRVMQGSGSAALIPVPPRNCRHLGTCLRYLLHWSAPKHPAEAEPAALVSQALTPPGPISEVIQQQEHQPGSDVPISGILVLFLPS